MNVAESQRKFKQRTHKALLDNDLRAALGRARGGFVEGRRARVAELPEFEQLRDAANEIREHTLAHLDYYLLTFEKNVERQGGTVHFASTPADLQRIVLDICRDTGARRVAKGKSMVSEETGLNDALEDAGIECMETDLGEYIIQLAKEPPSHIIAPAVHKTRAQITELFHQHHGRYGITERAEDRESIVREARTVLRQTFLNADVGITGANFLVAESGSNVLVTNEGNGDLTSNLPKVHIVTAGIEKVIPTFDDLSVFLRLLGRSATGQEMSVYTTVYSGPARATDVEGPEQYHVILLDNGRSTMLGNEFHEMLRCIRCGACLNHCPVYSSIGGHAYGWVYSGPMGAVLTPLVKGVDSAYDLPNACTLNGRCQEVCPMRIPLPSLLRKLRQRQVEARLTPARQKISLSAWGALARRPRLYQFAMSLMTPSLAWLGRSEGHIRYLPMAGGWTRGRQLPVPQGSTFMRQWRQRDEKTHGDRRGKNGDKKITDGDNRDIVDPQTKPSHGPADRGGA
ncbi:MAG: iron-sulfur cluster-binding protein [marine bacterium B5-7]|nr:MAG: iron-sulfur cluster-binding protein [marine bacterium B5-7]